MEWWRKKVIDRLKLIKTQLHTIILFFILPLFTLKRISWHFLGPPLNQIQISFQKLTWGCFESGLAKYSAGRSDSESALSFFGLKVPVSAESDSFGPNFSKHESQTLTSFSIPNLGKTQNWNVDIVLQIAQL